MRKRRLTLSVAMAAVASVVIGVIAVQGASAAGPVIGTPTACTPPAAHPYPVVLVHGTFEQASQWSQFGPTLTARGYCVYALNYGNNATGDITKSAAQLSTYVNQVLAATHASKVDLIGHSQGGMMPRYYLKNLGGAAKVHQLVGIAPSNYGTTLDGIATLAGQGGGILGPVIGLLCTACQQQIQGSAFLKALNSPTDTVPGVIFTVIETNKDEVVTPYANAFLKGAGDVHNITIQDVCPKDASGHIALANSDQNTWQEVYNALDPANSQPITCVAATDGV